MNITITVIIPSYNMGEHISGAIYSVLSGEFHDLEVIVIDDGSTDVTRSIVLEYTNPDSLKYDPRVQYQYQSNRGKSVAVNRGIQMSSGKYITILDADDEITPSSLLQRYEAIRESKTCMSVGGFEVFKGCKILGRREPPSCTKAAALRRQFYLSYKTPFSLNNCLISKEIIDQTGFFDSELKRCQDIDYVIRLLEHVENVGLVDGVVYRYRKHRSSIKERLRFRLKTLFYRAKVIWKNFRGPFGVFIVLYAGLLDIGKTLYEITGVYKR